MSVLSFNCKIRPFMLALESSILTRLRIMNLIMVNSADATLPYLIRGHAVIINKPHVQMSMHVNSQPD